MKYLLLVLFLFSIRSNAQIQADTTGLPKYYSNYAKTSSSKFFKGDQFYVDSVYANSFPIMFNKYDTGKTTIKMREDTSVILGTILLDSNYLNGFHKFYFTNGKLRSLSSFKDGELLLSETFDFKGRRTSRYDNEKKISYQYSSYKDTVYLQKISIFSKGGLIPLYINNRDSLFNPVFCFYAYSENYYIKNYYTVSPDTSYQITYKYRNNVVFEDANATKDGNIIYNHLINYPIEEIKKSKFYNCPCKQNLTFEKK